MSLNVCFQGGQPKEEASSAAADLLLVEEAEYDGRGMESSQFVLSYHQEYFCIRSARPASTPQTEHSKCSTFLLFVPRDWFVGINFFRSGCTLTTR